VSIACDCPLGLCPSGHHSSECFGGVRELMLDFDSRWRLLGTWPKIFLCLLRHARSHYLIEIFYIMESILFSYFGLKIFSFWKARFDSQDFVVVRFPYPSLS